MAEEKRDRLIRKPELLSIVGHSDATVWRWEKEGLFPKRLRVGKNTAAWLESEVYGWIAERASER